MARPYMRQNVSLSKEELVFFINRQIDQIKELEDEIQKLKDSDSGWTKAEAQIDGGGFTDQEILNDISNNW